MADFSFDQAEGLRRMLGGARPRVVAFLSVLPAQDKRATMQNLKASLERVGRDVVVVAGAAGLVRQDLNSTASGLSPCDIVLVDAEPNSQLLPDVEIVIQVGTSPASITAGYTLVKRLAQQFGRRPLGLLVSGAASESEAKLIYDNMASAASRYLAIELSSMGHVPADDHVLRAARLGRPVVDAFPLAGSSAAFRRLAGRFAQPWPARTARPGANAFFGT